MVKTIKRKKQMGRPKKPENLKGSKKTIWASADTWKTFDELRVKLGTGITDTFTHCVGQAIDQYYPGQEKHYSKGEGSRPVNSAP